MLTELRLGEVSGCRETLRNRTNVATGRPSPSLRCAGLSLVHWPTVSLSVHGVTFISLVHRAMVFTAGSRAFDQNPWSLGGLGVLVCGWGGYSHPLHILEALSEVLTVWWSWCLTASEARCPG